MSRARINITIDSALLAEVDQWRGDEDRSAVIERAVRALMGPADDDPRQAVVYHSREAARIARKL